MNEKVLKIMEEVFECKVNENATRDNTENWDSINHVKLIIELNFEFNLNIKEAEFNKLNSFKEIVSYVNSQ